MTWNDAKKEVLQDIIRKKKLKVTALSVEAGFPRNFLTRVFSGDRSLISDDEIERLSPHLGFSVQEIARMAEQKKTPLLSRLTQKSLCR